MQENAYTAVPRCSTQIVNFADMKDRTEAIFKTLLTVYISLNSVKHFSSLFSQVKIAFGPFVFVFI